MAKLKIVTTRMVNQTAPGDYGIVEAARFSRVYRRIGA